MIPHRLGRRLRLPVVVSPMFLVSGPLLVAEACRAGVIGTFPTANLRSVDELAGWLDEIEQRLAAAGDEAAPYGVNLVLAKRDRGRIDEELGAIIARRVPLVITSGGAPGHVPAAVHAYGGLLLHTAASGRHARKALAAGADGIIAISAGSGGLCGDQNLVSLVREIRGFWDGLLAAAGSIGDGHAIRAVEVLGADLAYMGTRFLATVESMASDGHKRMVVDCGAEDVVHTDRVVGLPANMLLPSLRSAGIDPAAPSELAGLPLASGTKAWRDIWSAGQGVATIVDIPSVAELIARLEDEYHAACTVPPFRQFKGRGVPA